MDVYDWLLFSSYTLFCCSSLSLSLTGRNSCVRVCGASEGTTFTVDRHTIGSDCTAAGLLHAEYQWHWRNYCTGVIRRTFYLAGLWWWLHTVDGQTTDGHAMKIQ